MVGFNVFFSGKYLSIKASNTSLPGIIRVLDDVPPLRFPIWLVTHRELRTSRRIRVVFEALAQGLA